MLTHLHPQNNPKQTKLKKKYSKKKGNSSKHLNMYHVILLNNAKAQ